MAGVFDHSFIYVAQLPGSVKFGQPSKWTPETIRKVEAGIRAGKRVAEVALDAGLAEATIRLRYNASALEQLRARGKR